MAKLKADAEIKAVLAHPEQHSRLVYVSLNECIEILQGTIIPRTLPELVAKGDVAALKQLTGVHTDEKNLDLLKNRIEANDASTALLNLRGLKKLQSRLQTTATSAAPCQHIRFGQPLCGPEVQHAPLPLAPLGPAQALRAPPPQPAPQPAPHQQAPARVLSDKPAAKRKRLSRGSIQDRMDGLQQQALRDKEKERVRALRKRKSDGAAEPGGQ